MSRPRKTRDVWNVQQYTGPLYGWETVTPKPAPDPASIERISPSTL